MHIVIPILILGMFVVWIFNLKKEINGLQDRISSSKHRGHAVRTPADIASVKVPKKGDVQTWVLE